MKRQSSCRRNRALLLLVWLWTLPGCDQQPSAVVSPTPGPGSTTPAPVATEYVGAVREPGAGPVAGVTVACGPGTSVETDAEGRFTCPRLTSRLLFQKTGYRYALWTSSLGPADAIDVRMQRILTLTTTPLTATVYPDDPEYSIELGNMFWDQPYFCRPCRFVSVRPTIKEGTRIRVRWSGSAPLDLVAGDYYSDGPQPAVPHVAGPSELVLPIVGPVDVLLVGPGRRNGAPPDLSEPVTFTVTIEEP